jgi:hypothetical protein
VWVTHLSCLTTIETQSQVLETHLIVLEWREHHPPKQVQLLLLHNLLYWASWSRLAHTFMVLCKDQNINGRKTGKAYLQKA